MDSYQYPKGLLNDNICHKQCQHITVKTFIIFQHWYLMRNEFRIGRILSTLILRFLVTESLHWGSVTYGSYDKFYSMYLR